MHIKYLVAKDAYMRVSDSWGQGHFHASRGTRRHKGVDYEVPLGSAIIAPVAGTITKLGYAYNDDLSFRYVEITEENDLRVRIFYVQPAVVVLDSVIAGDIIGHSQDLEARYKEILQHVHLEILKPDGDEIDPDEYEQFIN